MKVKILYYMEGVFDLLVAKSIKEKFSTEIYALIDVNQFQKKTFINQNIIELKQVWFFQDLMIGLDKKPDLDYLSNFEKKYNVNLWLIAYKERAFYQFNSYYKFSRDQILQIFEKECRLFEKILESNPDFLIIKNPDYHHNQLLYEICKAVGIKILTINHSRLGYKYFISNKPDTIDNLPYLMKHHTLKKKITFDELQKNIQSYWQQISKVPKEYHVSFKKQIRASLRYLTKVCNDDYRKYFVNFGRTRIKVLIKESSLAFQRIYREFYINNNLKKQIKKENFVYFPLHFQPERSTLVAAPFYQNQLEVISHIARSLPINFKLYVKEHPVQIKYGWRPVSFYKTIMDFPNVELLHPSVSNYELMKESSIVISISGTAAFEAAFYKKPSMVFSDTGFSILPSVKRIKSYEELPGAIRGHLQTNVEPSDLGKFIEIILDNSFQYDNISFDIEMLRKFFYGGFLYDVKIPLDELLHVYEKHKKIFDDLGTEYIKKIKSLIQG